VFVRRPGQGRLVTRLEDMDSVELHAELNYWTAQALIYAREHLAASESGDLDWEHNMKVALRHALDQVRRLDRMVKVGIAA